MTILEKKERLINLRENIENIISKGEVEARELTENELNEMTEIKSEIDSLQNEIKEEEQRNLDLTKEINNKTEIKEERKMNNEVKLVDLINGIVEGRNFSAEEQGYVKGNTISTRATIQAGAETYGKENIAEDKMNLDVAIRNNSVLDKIGATWFGNATGNVNLPKYAGSSVSWKGEGVTADDGAGNFSEVTLSPKRLTAYIDVSKQFLLQSKGDVEALLINDLAKAIAEKLDKTIFGAEEGSDTIPTGLLNGTYVENEVTAIDAITYDEVLKLEEKVEEKNGTDFIFVTSPKVKYALRNTQMASGLNMVYENGEIDGVTAIVSNSVASKGILCVCPQDIAVAQWGGIEIVVDEQTRAIYDEVRLVVNAYFDVKLRGERVAGTIFA